jgi:hypothetical protein
MEAASGEKMKKLVHFVSLILVIVVVLPVAGSNQEDAAADSVAQAFVQARQAAHLPNLARMGRNTFREKICKNDRRFPSGLIDDVTYETSDPANLPSSALRLAASSDAGNPAARFALGVCMKGSDSSGHPQYSVFIALYNSRWLSFWSILRE